MIKSWKTALRASSRSQNEQGFALPVAVGLGFIMILVGTTMILRSQDDQVTASAQKQTAQSLSIAEGAISRTLAKLNQPDNAYMLTQNYDPINLSINPNKTYLGSNQIQNDGDGETSAVNTWSTPPSSGGCLEANTTLPSGLLSDSIGSGTYQLKAYRYSSTNQVGALLVEGVQGDSVSRIQVSVPVSQRPKKGSFPGLYASSSISLGNNDVLQLAGESGANANVICRDCKVPNTSQCRGGQPTPAGLESAVNKGPKSVISGDIYLVDPQIPSVPTPPTNTTCSSSTSATACRINLEGPLDASTTPVLPRPGDISSHKAGTPYHYVMENMPLGNDTLTINSATHSAKNPSGDPVYLYVSENITLSGNGGILHTGSPERFVIFGNPVDPTNAITDQQFTISGGSNTSSVFIFAPDATIGINGGSSDPDIKGAVWAKTWNGSSSDTAEIRVPDNMNQLLASAFGSTFDIGVLVNKSAIATKWQRLEAR